jgi:5-methyltetrahydrofolate--homocysteine methyltransferase
LVPGSGLPPAAEAAAERLGGRVLDGCNEILSLTRPDTVEAVHRAYFEAGADVVETNTFGCTSVVLAEYEVPELVRELAAAAARLALRAAADFPGRFVAGAVGPGTRLLSLGHVGWEEVRQTYFDAYSALLEAGVHALLLETQQDLLLTKAGIVAMHDAMDAVGRRVPLIVQATFEQTGTMLMGTEVGAVTNMVECFPEVVAFGLNCATGPQEMATHLRAIAECSTRPLSVQPNAGLPVMEGGRAVYKLGPRELAEHHVRFVEEFGAILVGGCCGTTPEHTRAVRDAVEGLRPGSRGGPRWMRVRHLFPGFDFRLSADAAERAKQEAGFGLVGCSSLYQFQPYEQDSSLLIVGERTNANGSKAFREMLGVENWDGLTELAREVEAEGSHVLDVCAAYVGRDEAADMRRLLGAFNQHVGVPIMVDSTEADVVEASLQCLAGKPIVNSVNFEDGEARTAKVLALCRRYGAAVVGLTIDESGMAKSAEKKVEVASRILAATRSFGLPDHDVFLDCLTFTLGSGDEEFRRSAVETIEAVRELRRRFPRANSILGVSNVSFGLRPAARTLVNSVFLHYAREAGLTAAIVHASKIRRESEIPPDLWGLASDLVFDRRRFAEAG